MGDKIRQPTDNCMMSWQSMWAYFQSTYCTDEMRKFTMKNMPIVDYLDGATEEVQYEILQYAPQVLIRHPAIQKVLHPTVRSKLTAGVGEPTNRFLDKETFLKIYRSIK